MDLKELREQIDQIDRELLPLFVRRMEIAAKVAEFKKAHNLPIHVPSREQQILCAVEEKAGPEMAEYAQALYSTLFTLSRDYQDKHNNDENNH